MTYNWISKVYKKEVKRPEKFPVKRDRRTTGDVTMSIEDLRELRRSHYYKQPDHDLTDWVVKSRLERELKINNDIERRKDRKDERDRIMELYGLDH